MRDRDHLGARRDTGLRRLSKLTWRVTLLSSVGVAGLVNLFSSSASSTATASARSPRTPVRPPAGPPALALLNPGATRHLSKKALSSAQASKPVAAPSKTLAPPPQAPAPAPAPAPPPVTTSSGSHGGG